MRMLHSNILCILSFKSTGCSIRNSLVYMIHSFKNQKITVCPGSSDPQEKILNIFASKVRFKPFFNYYDIVC